MAKMRRIRKPLAWALSVMLIFTALPLTAFADEAAPPGRYHRGCYRNSGRPSRTNAGGHRGTDRRADADTRTGAHSNTGADT